jgi:tetratricopeptide (TPR) repeat protein
MEQTALNPILTRIKKLELLWSHFTAKSDARICRWLVEEDEVRMIMGFVELASEKDSTNDDIFFEVEQPFTSVDDYSNDLVQYLEKITKDGAEDLQNEGTIISWTPTNYAANEKNKASYFLQNFSTLAKELPLSPTSLAVAFLVPSDFDKDFNKWLKQAIEAKIPDNIRLMLLDVKEFKWFEQLAKENQDAIITLEPELDMYSAMSQLAAQAAQTSAKPNDPGHLYSQAFVDLANAAKKMDLIILEQRRHLPQKIAKQQNWPHLEVAVLSLVAGTYFAVQKFKESLPYYDESLSLSRCAIEKGEPSGYSLLIQTLISKAASFIAIKDTKNALPLYSEAAEYLENSDNFLLKMEAYRMKGYCLLQQGDHEAAWVANLSALKSGQYLDPKTYESTTLPYVCKSLLELAYSRGNKSDYNAIVDVNKAMLGEDWEKKLNNIKN